MTKATNHGHVSVPIKIAQAAHKAKLYVRAWVHEHNGPVHFRFFALTETGDKQYQRYQTYWIPNKPIYEAVGADQAMAFLGG